MICTPKLTQSMGKDNSKDSLVSNRLPANVNNRDECIVVIEARQGFYLCVYFFACVYFFQGGSVVQWSELGI